MTGQARLGFEDLDCFQLALQVLKEAYRVASRLPARDRYNLAGQLRQAATRATWNIAEGYGRYYHPDKLRFFTIARRSLSETLGGLIDCQAAGYIDEAELANQRSMCHRAVQSLNDYVCYIERRRQGQKEFGDRILRGPEVRTVIQPESMHPEYLKPEFAYPET